MPSDEVANEIMHFKSVLFDRLIYKKKKNHWMGDLFTISAE